MISKKSVGLLILGVISVGAISFGVGTVAVSALTSRSKAEKLADLIDKPVEEVIEEKYNSNKTYGEIAAENEVLNQFCEQNVNCNGAGNGIHSSRAENRVHSNNHSPVHYHHYDDGRGHRQGRHLRR